MVTSVEKFRHVLLREFPSDEHGKWVLLIESLSDSTGGGSSFNVMMSNSRLFRLYRFAIRRAVVIRRLDTRTSRKDLSIVFHAFVR